MASPEPRMSYTERGAGCSVGTPRGAARGPRATVITPGSVAHRPSISALLLTIGEPTAREARASIESQDHPLEALVVIENVSPFSRAVELGVAGIRSEFFVQV